MTKLPIFIILLFVILLLLLLFNVILKARLLLSKSEDELNLLAPVSLNILENVPMEINTNVVHIDSTLNTVKILLAHTDKKYEQFYHTCKTFDVGNNHTLILSPPQEFQCFLDGRFEFLSGFLNVVHILNHTNINVTFINFHNVSLVSTRVILYLLNFIISLVSNFQANINCDPANIICIKCDDPTASQLFDHLSIFISNVFNVSRENETLFISQSNIPLQRTSALFIKQTQYESVPITYLIDEKYRGVFSDTPLSVRAPNDSLDEDIISTPLSREKSNATSTNTSDYYYRPSRDMGTNKNNTYIPNVLKSTVWDRLKQFTFKRRPY